ncbi:MAG: DNA repair protein RecN [Gemmatimonadota bacterium]
MLLELRIRNLAVIEQLAIHLESGLNALTGETGAGKSIIVGALSLLLGERASADTIRSGADKAVVEGVFDVAHRKDILRALADQGIEANEGLLILRREVAAEGRSRAWVNGAASTATLLGELGRLLVDLHGQHEHQTLLKRGEQREILDEYTGAGALAQHVSDAHARVRVLESELASLERRRLEAEQRADYLRFQAGDIEAAKLKLGEEEENASEAVRLEHAEELATLAQQLHQTIYAAEKSVIGRLAELRRVLDHLIRIDASQADGKELLENAYYALEDLGRRMGDYADGIEYDPERLEQLRQRQDLIFRLKSKYGPALEDVIAAGEKARAELSLVDDAAIARQDLEKALAEARAILEKQAGELSKQRRKASARLQKEVAALLPGLGMAGGRFEIALEPQPAITAAGAESVEFRIALNAGFEPRSLARIASGGELSRVMLALKNILARVDRIPTLFFE